MGVSLERVFGLPSRIIDNREQIVRDSGDGKLNETRNKFQEILDGLHIPADFTCRRRFRGGYVLKMSMTAGNAQVLTSDVNYGIFDGFCIAGYIGEANKQGLYSVTVHYKDGDKRN